MKYQQKWFNCGPAALGNALECLNIKVSQDELDRLCGSTLQGTNEKGLIRAITKLGLEPRIISNRNAQSVVTTIGTSIYNSRPVIACVDNWEHWFAVVGLLGIKYIVVDSATEDLVLCLDAKQLEARLKPQGRRWSYAIALEQPQVSGVAKN